MRRAARAVGGVLVALAGVSCSSDDRSAGAALEGTSWVADAFLDGDERVVLEPPSGPGTLTFGEDGSVTRFDGCNGLGYERYEVDGTELRFTDPGFSTLVGCLDDRYETRFRAVTDGTMTFAIDGDELILRAPDGRGIAFTTAA